MLSIIEEKLSAEKVITMISQHEANKKALKAAIGGLTAGAAGGSAVTAALKPEHTEKVADTVAPVKKTLDKYAEENPGKAGAIVAGALLAGLAARKLLKRKERSDWGMK